MSGRNPQQEQDKGNLFGGTKKKDWIFGKLKEKQDSDNMQVDVPRTSQKNPFGSSSSTPAFMSNVGGKLGFSTGSQAISSIQGKDNRSGFYSGHFDHKEQEVSMNYEEEKQSRPSPSKQLAREVVS